MIKNAHEELGSKIECLKYVEVEEATASSYIRFVEQDNLRGACATSMIGRAEVGPNTIFVTASCVVRVNSR